MAGILNSNVATTPLPSSAPGAFGDQTIDQEFLAPLDEIDFDAIEQRYGIARHSGRHDLENHVKVGVLEVVDPSPSLDTLAAKTATYDGVDYMPKSRFSELTNGRTCQAGMAVLSELLPSPPLYHRRAHLRNRLDWLDRPVVASDASNRSLKAPITLPDVLDDAADDGDIRPEDGGLRLHLATRVDGQSKQPLAATVTHPDTHENTQLAQLNEAVDDFDDLENPIDVWDRGYTDYDRFCEKNVPVTTSSRRSRRTIGPLSRRASRNLLSPTRTERGG